MRSSARELHVFPVHEGLGAPLSPALGGFTVDHFAARGPLFSKTKLRSYERSPMPIGRFLPLSRTTIEPIVYGVKSQTSGIEDIDQCVLGITNWF
jgi:hypothetical protein